MNAVKPYKKGDEQSYTRGAFPTIELLDARPGDALGVFIHSKCADRAPVEDACRRAGVPVFDGDRAIERVAGKENVYVLGVFRRFSCELCAVSRHIALVNPGDMGNLGTILRTALGFGYRDVALIRPAADAFDPKCVRASMGALFRVRHAYFDSWQDYAKAFPERKIYPFMTDGARPLRRSETPPERFTLVFGNESSGLPPEFASLGETVFIPQSDEVDSLNLTIAAAVGMFAFGGNNG